MTEETFRHLVRELTQDNRHAVAMWLVARRFAFTDLCREFAAVWADWRKVGNLSDEAATRMHTAYKEMRRRIIEQFGPSRWAEMPL